MPFSNGIRRIIPATVMTDLNANYRISRSIESTLQIQNLTDIYHKEQDALYPVIGRQSKVGLRVRL
jgi:outer membrane receptor protein involved in Fe transport